MNELVYKSEKGTAITTSLLVAEKFGKNHFDVLKAIRNLECSDDFHKSNFAFMFNITEIGNGAKRKDPYTVMTKDGFSFLVMGFTGKEAAKFKEEYINAFNSMEAKLKLSLPQTFSEALQLAADQAKKIEVQAIELKTKEQIIINNNLTIRRQAPKVEYVDQVLDSKSEILTTIIAKELELSAITLNNLLRSSSIIFKQGYTWVLYRKYQDLEYAKIRTHIYDANENEQRTSHHLVWTEKGRNFIHQVAKEKGWGIYKKVDDCGKEKFENPQMAIHVAKMRNKAHNNHKFTGQYYCEDCKAYHLTTSKKNKGILKAIR